ncbi:xylulokinase [Geodermatophilus sp. DSM 45219]|uniref:xylulokinase n=1 Tax=Geodermatophilus sp. DSM 45219 TaxID=1881103 RepID=UPI00087EE00C|nr:FGGY-family carbohydrate kinase [Geodermatophilus sp. DSM 45219]SDN58794.1 Sugar (pentulose or hexulose) kinase [Geodermatophilus sp. DSM 45219]
MTTDAGEAITAGRTALGIELGSTRIKAVLVGPDHAPLAVGSYDWENQFVDRRWTYSLEAVWAGVQQSVAALAEDVRRRHGVELAGVGALGVSAMMHGYLAFDGDGELLTPFRTWRNTNTGRSAERLSAEFGVNIPHRWSVAHLYQAILDREDHVGRLDHLTTLAGYVHWQLTGEKVLGIGDASGMFPIDTSTDDRATAGWSAPMLARFDQLAAEAGAELTLADLLPGIASAGQPAGELTEAGAKLLDPTGRLRPGIPLCPPEGDAGTGMVATNSVAPRTGNVSAGTSIFAMVVLEHDLAGVHRELDLVTTPAGDPVAMVHCNNGASELDAWAGLFTEFARALGSEADPSAVFEVLFSAALDGASDGGGMVAYNYLSGEPITDFEEGRPLFVRSPDSRFDLGTFMRAHLFSSLATLRIGMDVLQRTEGVRLDRMFAHGGLFRTKGVAQRFLAAAIDTPVSVGDVAAEGGAWGIAVLAAFATRRSPGQGLADYLDTAVFTGATLQTAQPEPADVAGFDAFMQRYVAGLPVERAAVDHVGIGHRRAEPQTAGTETTSAAPTEEQPA